MTPQEKDRIECAIRHIQTAVDIDPWAVEIAVEAMEKQIPQELSKNSPKLDSGNGELATDCISRQAAIDAECEVCQIAPKKERGHNCTYYVHGCKEIECLRALPSAQPETAKRIVGKSRNGMTLWYQCDMCNEPVDAQDNFCRGCGRRLTDG